MRDGTALRPGDHWLALFDELTGIVVDIISTGAGSDWVAKDVEHYVHYDFSDSIESTSHGVGMYRDIDTYPGSCEFWLDNRSWEEDGGAEFRHNDGALAFLSGCLPSPPLSLSGAGGATNAYYWMSDLENFANHGDAGYDGGPYHWIDENEEVLVVDIIDTPDNPGDACGYAEVDWNWFDYYYRISLAKDCGAPTDLRTIAHEYGHFLGFMYDFHFDHDDPIPLQRVAEGFADHNILRYAKWKGWGNIAGVPGARVPFDVPGGTIDGPGHFLVAHTDEAIWDSDCASSGSQYECIEAMVVAYWDLAWNKCNVPYKYCPYGDTRIIQSADDAYANQFANIAYTYAILTDPDDIEEFGLAVDNYYLGGVTAGVISWNDYYRAQSVLNHHCLGADNGCDSMHKRPGLTLPARFTSTARFTTSGNEKHQVSPWPDGYDACSGTGCTFVNFPENDGTKYVTVNRFSDSIEFDIYVPDTHVYLIDVLLRPRWSGSLSVLSVYYDNVLITNLPAPGTVNEWSWMTMDQDGCSDRLDYYGATPRCSVPLAVGWHTIKLKGKGSFFSLPVDVEAMTLKKGFCGGYMYKPCP